MAKGTIKRIQSLKQIAAFFDVTPRWINRLGKEKDFPKVSRGKYDLIECVRWYIAYLQKQIEDAHHQSDSLSRSEERTAKYRADMLELKLAQARGELISIRDIVGIVEKPLAAIRSVLLGIPKHAARELNNKEVEMYLDAFVRKALDELSTIPDKLNGARTMPDGDREFNPDTLETPTQVDGKPMGGPVQSSKPGSKRGKRPVANLKSGVPA